MISFRKVFMPLCAYSVLVVAGPAATAQCPGEWLSGWGLPGVDGRVSALSVWDDGNGLALYVGGDFDVAGDVFAKNIARWDGTTWQALENGTDGRVVAVTAFNGSLIAAGNFGVMEWNGTQWSQLGSGVDGVVNALTTYNGELIAAGRLWSAGGAPVDSIARWNGTSWSSLGTGITGDVYALTVHGGTLVAGGTFWRAGGVPVTGIAMWGGAEWSALAGDLDGDVYALAVFGGDLIAGGSRSWICDDIDICFGSFVKRWAGDGWVPLKLDGNNLDDDSISALTVFNGDLVSASDRGVAIWDGVHWSDVSTDLYITDALGEFDGELIAGGGFRVGLDGLRAHNVARWNGIDWSRLGDGIDAAVHTATLFRGRLVIGGLSGVLEWDGLEWSSLVLQRHMVMIYLAHTRGVFRC